MVYKTVTLVTTYILTILITIAECHGLNIGLQCVITPMLKSKH